MKKQYICLHCCHLRKVCPPSCRSCTIGVHCLIILLLCSFIKFTAGLAFIYSFFSLKQTCLGVYKCINVPCVIKMDFVSLGWLSNLFLFLASFIFPHTFSSDFDVLRIIYSSSAFNKYVPYLLVNQNCCFETFFVFLFA